MGNNLHCNFSGKKSYSKIKQAHLICPWNKWYLLFLVTSDYKLKDFLSLFHIIFLLIVLVLLLTAMCLNFTSIQLVRIFILPKNDTYMMPNFFTDQLLFSIL